ncbi:helix-turn-helix domain-containing protein [Halocatena halophila]|uniref:helix-turn-helix domain-containing protein n=1 Tax=Halocatena halophila TaxID=2814576 RepID=UPI002ED5884F
MGSTNDTGVKIEDTLTELLALSRRPNADVAGDIGVSPATLSAYRRGEARPSLSALVSIVEVFEVSLDYLVFGERPENAHIESGPIIRQMSKSLQNSLRESQLRQERHTATVANVGRRLSTLIDETVESELAEISESRPFTEAMNDEQIEILERHSETTRLFIKSFEYNLLDHESSTPGEYFPTVVRNLSRGQSYRYLLPARTRDWEPVIEEFRALLIENVPNETTVHRNCEFKITETPTMAGCTMYNLAMDELEQNEPVLYDLLTEYGYCSAGQFGYAIAPSMGSKGTMVMDAPHREQAFEIFDELWDAGTVV